MSQRRKSECVGNRVLGLPTPGRFGCGLSPINVLVPQPMPVSGNDCESDMDLSSDSEDDVHSYFSSSRGTTQSKQGCGNRVEHPHHTEELLDSATSTKVPFMQSRSNNGECDRGTGTLDDHSPRVTAGENVERTAKQVSYSKLYNFIAACIFVLNCECLLLKLFLRLNGKTIRSYALKDMKATIKVCFTN